MTDLSEVNLNNSAAVGPQVEGKEGQSKFPAYPEYKASGVEWLGNIPQHWFALEGKRLFANVRDPAKSGAEQLASTQAYGVIPQKQFMERNNVKVVLALAGTDNFKDVRVDDFVISLRSFQGGIEYSAYNGCVSPAYTVLRRKVEGIIDPAFFRYLLKEQVYISALQSVTTGIREGRAITYDQFGSLPLPIAPLFEQAQIAHFLDHETARIDALIEEQQRLIELLKEKRQAVISDAVTKGLDPTALMKVSGVEWLGEVPAHWDLKALRYLGYCQNGINIGGEAFGSGLPFVSYGDVYKNDVLPCEVSGLVQSSTEDQQRYSVEYGDVFFTRTSETVDEIGFSAICLKTLPCAVFAGFLIRFRSNSKSLTPEFSKYYFRNQRLRFFFNKEMNLVTRASLSQDLLKSLPVTLPPVFEQIKISEFLDGVSEEFSSLLMQGIEAIDLLKERRSALISAAVTGKIDVRGWQPPASSPTPELVQEAV